MPWVVDTLGPAPRHPRPIPHADPERRNSTRKPNKLYILLVPLEMAQWHPRNRLWGLTLLCNRALATCYCTRDFIPQSGAEKEREKSGEKKSGGRNPGSRSVPPKGPFFNSLGDVVFLDNPVPYHVAIRSAACSRGNLCCLRIWLLLNVNGVDSFQVLGAQ